MKKYINTILTVVITFITVIVICGYGADVKANYVNSDINENTIVDNRDMEPGYIFDNYYNVNLEFKDTEKR